MGRHALRLSASVAVLWMVTGVAASVDLHYDGRDHIATRIDASP